MSSLRTRATSASWLAACLLASATLVPTAVLAHGNHTHGHGNVQLSIDGETVTATFEVPLESFLGYDYPPKGAAQEQIWTAFKERLGNPLNFIEPAADAQCALADSRIVPDPATARPEADIDNITYTIAFRCARPEALKSFSFTAFRDHAGLRQLRVQLVNGKQRKTMTVRPRFPAIAL